MKTLKLEVGKAYRSRKGEDVKIVRNDNTKIYPCQGSNGKWYAESGQWCSMESPHDLIEEVPSETRHIKICTSSKGGRKMKTLVEKLKDYNRWRRGDKTIPQPSPKEVGEMIDQVIEAFVYRGLQPEEGGGVFQSCGLRVLNGELSLQAVGWNDVRLLLSKVQLLAVLHDLKWVDVQHDGFTMMVEPDSDIELLAAEFEEWKKERL